jgi:hypothetical protein
MGDYRTNTQFFNDVLLMFSNCDFYWPKNSEEHKCGSILSEYLTRLLNEYNVYLAHDSSLTDID